MQILIVLNVIGLILLLGVIWLLARKKDPALNNWDNKFNLLEKNQGRIETTIKDEVFRSRSEINSSLSGSRQEMVNQLTKISELNEQKINALRDTVDNRLRDLQADNSQKLEQMRQVVDEKLQNTLEKRLGESFKLVSERLESVYKGLGEMQQLALSVGDLKNVLSNVKVRGTWGEIQLGMLLEEMLAPNQYAANVATKTNSLERVEFAVKLPGRDNNEVWLPLDAKFPQEDYQRLVEAQEQGNPELVEKYAKQLEVRIKAEAKDIRDKYLDPPQTTDFGIMFIPTESLYAEILRRPGLAQTLQRDYRVVIAGPTTLTALLNSLQMGFRTLAIEKRASEVWQVLGLIKSEFAKFGDILERTKKKLQEASNIVEEASSKSRNIQTKLKKVQELPAPVLENEQEVSLD